jgi:hypothetical protein
VDCEPVAHILYSACHRDISGEVLICYRIRARRIHKIGSQRSICPNIPDGYEVMSVYKREERGLLSHLKDRLAETPL